MKRTNLRRGLTMVEVVCSAALLSIIAATCLPILQRTLGAASSAQTTSFDSSVFEEFVTQQCIALELEKFTTESIPDSVHWADEGRTVHIQVIEVTDDDLLRRWITFTCDKNEHWALRCFGRLLDDQSENESIEGNN